MTEPKKNSPIWLIASLVLNGLLLGLIGGHLLGQTRQGPPSGAADRHLAQSMTRIVDPAERAQLRAAFKEAYESTRAEREEVRRMRGELAKLIAAESYDEADVREAFSRLRDAETAAKAGLHDTLAAQMSKLSPDQRAAILRNTAPEGRRERMRRTRPEDR